MTNSRLVFKNLIRGRKASVIFFEVTKIGIISEKSVRSF